MSQPLQLEGVIQNAKPQGEPYGANQTRYSFSELVDTDGYVQALMWVNRDVLGLEGRNVLIVDTSDTGEKIKYEMDGKGQPRYRIYGTKVSIQLEDGTEVGLAQQSPAYTGPPQQPVPQQAQRQQPQAPAPRQQPAQRQASQQMSTQAGPPNRGKSAPMRELVDYGLAAVNYARSQGEDSGEVLASVYGAAMYGFKEGRPACPIMNHTGTVPHPAHNPPAVQAPPHPQGPAWTADETDAIPAEYEDAPY